MTPAEKADRAKQLLSDELLKECFSTLRERMVERMEACPFGDVDTQHEIALGLQVLKQVKVQLHSYINDLTLIEHQQRQESFMERMRQRITG